MSRTSRKSCHLALLLLAATPCAAQTSGGDRTVSALRDSIARARGSLARGRGDSALIYVGLVAPLYRVGRPVEAREALFAAAAASSDSARRALQRELRSALPSDGILGGRWDSMTAPERARRVRRMWDNCDVDVGQPLGFCLQAHFGRVAAAEARFALRRGQSERVMDERGRVWVKQGPPSRRRVLPGAPAYEIWHYDRPFGSLILYFTDADSTGARVPMHLVSSLEHAPPHVRLAACTLDSASCTGGARPVPIPGMFSEPAWVSASNRAILAGSHFSGPRRTVRGATAREYALRIPHFPPRFTNSMVPRTQILALNGGSQDGRRFLAALEFDAGDLVAAAHENGSRYRLDYRVMFVDSTNLRTQWDTTLVISQDTAQRREGLVTAVLDFPVPEHLATMSIAVSSDGGKRFFWSRFVEMATQLPIGSDLVLGNAPSGIAWERGSSHVPLNPSRTYDVGDTVLAFIQTVTPGAIDSIWGRIVLGDGPAPPSPQHRLVVRQVAMTREAGRVEHRFRFATDDLAPGTYHISFGLWWNPAASATGWAAFRFESFTLRPRSHLRPTR